MSEQHVTVTGYVVSIAQDARKCRVAIQHETGSYNVLPRGAGLDLAEEVNAQVEAHGAVEEQDEVSYMTVRGYKLLDDDETWGNSK